MLIENNSFDFAEFQNPDAFFWNGHLWFWNDKLNDDELFSQLEEMASIGAKNAWIIPVPSEFRPESMPTNMKPGYLTEDYLRLFSRLVEKMGNLDMRLWLYDDGGWPSGGVCGRIVKENPHLIQKTLVRYEKRPLMGETVKIPDDCIAGFMFRNNDMVCKCESGEELTVDTSDCIIEIYSAEPDFAWVGRPLFPDLLNPESIRVFIEKTHEEYKRHIGQYFGNVIPVIICDDVKVTHMPWTDDMASGFFIDKGYDLTDCLPSLFKGTSKKDMQVRVDYFDYWSKRFAETFFETIHKWCAENGVAFSGHLGGEEDILGARTFGHGHPMRNYREFDIPGVDAVWRHIYPAVKNIKDKNDDHKKDNAGIFDWTGITDQHAVKNDHFPKFASSVAHQDGKKYSWIELFSAYGSDLTVEQMKWITDFCYVRGINLMSSCERYLSTKDFYMAAMRPMLFPGNPIWNYLDLYHTYSARASYLLGLGTPEIKAAVYYPIRDVWAGSPQMLRAVGQSLETLTSALFENRCDFDFIDDDMLESEKTVTGNGILKTGQMEYTHIYISKCEWITEKSLQKLNDFVSSGGTVITFENGLSVNNANFKNMDLSKLTANLNSIVGVEPANSPIRACKRRLANGNLYFITNEGLENVSCVLKFGEDKHMQMMIVDPENGKIYTPSEAVYSDNVWSYQTELSFSGSLFVLFSEDKQLYDKADLTHTRAERNAVKILNSNWLYRKSKAYIAGDHDFEVIEMPDEPYAPIDLGDWCINNNIEPSFSGEVEYLLRFECGDMDLKRVSSIDLGVVKYACQVKLNGELVGKRAWSPFLFDVKDRLVQGENILRVIVANTMANQYVHTDLATRWPENLTGFYNRICLKFEHDSVPSGLYGPVLLF